MTCIPRRQARFIAPYHGFWSIIMRSRAEETDGDAEPSAIADGDKDDSQPSWMQDT